GFNQYPVTYGDPGLREAIAAKSWRYNQIQYDPQTEITVTCGATEAMIATLKALVNPGDEIIIFEPFYENYGPDAILSGAMPKYVSLRPPEWSYDSKELSRTFNRNTKAVIINTPNNPTGKVFSKGELQQIAALCIKWDCIAITDEVYEHILYDGERHISIASLEGMAERTVTINSISKTYSVTGWRVGWALCSADITSRIRKVHDFLTIGAPAPFQKAAAFALNMPEDYYIRLQAFYKSARDLLFETLSEMGFEVTLPKGAYYIMAMVDEMMEKLGANDDYSFGTKLIELAGIAAVPGSAFYNTSGMGTNQIRFCFAKQEKTLLDVRDRLKSLAQ
ncbi:MAG: aminotransferase class I/II-fold pyridoxal phosphate-dependent enzyme, partial [Deltaproteobacteria bacterium]|nr:aminotransferase class I/II-fold pyridoxal phosphate-dependent enzyme [Deltaproteobacteria bacterium]